MHRFGAQNGEGIGKEGQFFFKAGGVMGHVGAVVMHHPVGTDGQMIGIGLAVDEDHPVLAIISVRGLIISILADIDGSGQRRFFLRRERVKLPLGVQANQALAAMATGRPDQQRIGQPRRGYGGFQDRRRSLYLAGLWDHQPRNPLQRRLQTVPRRARHAKGRIEEGFGGTQTKGLDAACRRRRMIRIADGVQHHRMVRQTFDRPILAIFKEPDPPGIAV